ncbi:cupin domain-containing protein [Altererythrobacter salegens]|uniref:Cupin domain-containing protein n=1 Tax=Croceibacterium salegens TaxID=1737568 RepID=A0A6I4SYS7_9SPHN|nr:cupin domain-containing protein [Croceibacterium salegens]MXO60330.1 cupin domain-containing protein [Croceibacterium salegens]
MVLPVIASACATTPTAIPVYASPQGINQVLEGPIESAPGHSLVVGDLNMPAGAEIPRHYHYGEEFIYVLGGSATLSRAGMPDVELHPGDSLRIAPGVVHWGKAGPEGVRALSSWVKDDAKPLREPVRE